jgi:hypothetical protein
VTTEVMEEPWTTAARQTELHEVQAEFARPDPAMYLRDERAD